MILKEFLKITVDSSFNIGSTKYWLTRISGPYGPFTLALADGWLDSITSNPTVLNWIKESSDQVQNLHTV